jgi:ubiquinone/menaquinone biosynthesis C-methylase UbiE
MPVSASIDSPLAVIRTALPSFTGAAILDVGCGEGGLARLIASEGAMVTGVDPNLLAIARARHLVPGARFACACAEALPFDDGSFDAVVVVNALHHVPPDAMDKALAEASRVLRRSGSLVVVEPLAEGSFFTALQIVEDETAVRRAAQEALSRAVAKRLLKSRNTLSYIRRERFDDVEGFLERIVAVDPARAGVIEANRESITTAVLAAAERGGDGKLVFDQPIKADILTSGGAL